MSRSRNSIGIPSETSEEAAIMLFRFSEAMRRGDSATSWLVVINLLKAMHDANEDAWKPPIITLPSSSTMTGTAGFVITNDIQIDGR